MSGRAAAPQQGVHHGMEQHIRVGVPQQAAVIGDLHPAKHQLSPLCQAMDVVTVSNPQPCHHAIPRLSQIASARIKSIGVVIFKFS